MGVKLFSAASPPDAAKGTEDHDLLEKTQVNGLEQTKQMHDVTSADPDSDQSSCSCVRSMWAGWGIYLRQSVVLAGISLSLLYLTVLGFDGVTTGESSLSHCLICHKRNEVFSMHTLQDTSTRMVYLRVTWG